LITLVTILHVVVCVFLILVILLQAGKGGGMAGLGGGASQTVFGGRGSQTFLGKVTGGAAMIFMATSLTLAYQASKTSSVVEQHGGGAPFAPAPAGGAPAPAGQAPARQPAAPAQQPAAPAQQGGAAPSH
jgi:preprotein translocase subunit SecG